MKLENFSIIVGFLVLTTVYGCTNREESSGDTTKGEPAKAKPTEEIAIDKTITDLAKALTDFPKTRDKQSVLRFVTKDYVGIQDGEEFGPKETDKYLSDLLERINLGEPLGVSYQATNINSHASNATAWATYSFTYKLGSGGSPLEDREGKCTAILRRERDIWLLQHEHCSSQTARQQKELQDALIRGLLRK